MAAIQPDRPRLHVKTPGFDSTAMPMVPVPLPTMVDGNIRPLVSMAIKTEIFREQSLVALTGDAPSVPVAIEDLGDSEEKVPLVHHGRSETCLAEIVHHWNVKAIIDYTGGDGCLVRTALRHKVPILAFFKSKLHQAVVMEDIETWLLERMADPADTRFVGPSLAEDSAAKQTPADVPADGSGGAPTGDQGNSANPGGHGGDGIGLVDSDSEES